MLTLFCWRQRKRYLLNKSFPSSCCASPLAKTLKIAEKARNWEKEWGKGGGGLNKCVPLGPLYTLSPWWENNNTVKSFRDFRTIVSSWAEGFSLAAGSPWGKMPMLHNAIWRLYCPIRGLWREFIDHFSGCSYSLLQGMQTLMYLWYGTRWIFKIYTAIASMAPYSA